MSFLGTAEEEIGFDVGQISLAYAQDPATMIWPRRSIASSVLKSGNGAAVFYSFADVKRFVGSLNIHGIAIGAALMSAATRTRWSNEAIVVAYVRQHDDSLRPLIQEVTVNAGRCDRNGAGPAPLLRLSAADRCTHVFCSSTATDMDPVEDFAFARVHRPLLASVRRVAIEINTARGFP